MVPARITDTRVGSGQINAGMTLGQDRTLDVQVTGARCKVILGLTFLAAAATVFFGIIPSPLVDWATNAGEAVGSSSGPRCTRVSTPTAA